MVVRELIEKGVQRCYGKKKGYPAVAVEKHERF